jgi:hypothetical protein
MSHGNQAVVIRHTHPKIRYAHWPVLQGLRVSRHYSVTLPFSHAKAVFIALLFFYHCTAGLEREDGPRNG